MNRRDSVRIAIVLAAVACTAAGFAAARSAQEGLSLDRLPAAVRAAAEAHANGAAITEIEQGTMRGRVVYEVEFARNGGEVTVLLSDRGDALETETAIRAGDLPQVVRDAVEGGFPGGRIVEAESIEVYVFEVEVAHDGKTVEVRVLPNGVIEQQEADDDADDEEEDDDGEGDEEDDDAEGEDDDAEGEDDDGAGGKG
jgi:hypothetical protein